MDNMTWGHVFMFVVAILVFMIMLKKICFKFHAFQNKVCEVYASLVITFYFHVLISKKIKKENKKIYSSHRMFS